MDLPDRVLFGFQYGRNGIPVSCIYIHARMAGNRIGRMGFYVAKDTDGTVRREFYMEPAGV